MADSETALLAVRERKGTTAFEVEGRGVGGKERAVDGGAGDEGRKEEGGGEKGRDQSEEGERSHRGRQMVTEWRDKCDSMRC